MKRNDFIEKIQVNIKVETKKGAFELNIDDEKNIHKIRSNFEKDKIVPALDAIFDSIKFEIERQFNMLEEKKTIN